jgi:hypothetical protein
MTEEIGKIEKPNVASFKKGRKLFFVPLVFSSEDLPPEYVEKFNRYWDQAQNHIAELASKLGAVNRIYHEMVAYSGDAGASTIGEINEKSHIIVLACMENKASVEALEDDDILTEFMDWNRCLVIGLQNPRVINQIYEAYVTAAKKRTEYIARHIDETLKEEEIGLIFMRENHQVQFPPDIQVFYVAPPSLDEIKRWLREREQKANTEK